MPTRPWSGTNTSSNVITARVPPISPKVLITLATETPGVDIGRKNAEIPPFRARFISMSVAAKTSTCSA